MSAVREVLGVSRQVEQVPEGEGSPRTLRGMFAVYNELSGEIVKNGTKFFEIVAPGAFDRTLQELPDLVALYNHNDGMPLGRTSKGTFKIFPKDDGLAYVLDCPETSWADDLLASVAHGDTLGCSFAFTVPPGGDRWDRTNGLLIRTLLDVDLVEVTIGTAFPAYDATSIELRSLIRSVDDVPKLAMRCHINRRKLRLLDLDAV